MKRAVASGLVLLALGASGCGKSEKQVRVPNVVGDTEQVAIAALRGAGLRAEPSLAPSVKVPRGIVFSQKPPPVGDVSEGSLVNIVISSGPS